MGISPKRLLLTHYFINVWVYEDNPYYVYDIYIVLSNKFDTGSGNCLVLNLHTNVHMCRQTGKNAHLINFIIFIIKNHQMF